MRTPWGVQDVRISHEQALPLSSRVALTPNLNSERHKRGIL